MVRGWGLVVSFNLVTAAAYLTIVVIIVRGLVRTRQLRRNRLAVATAAIFLTAAAHHVRHAFDLVGGVGADQLSMMRESMGGSLDVTVTAGTALTGVVYLGLRRSYGLLLRSPAMFDNTSEARYRQLAANLPHTVVLLVDPDLRFVLVEGAGLSAEERQRLEGRLLRETVTPEWFAELEPHYRAIVTGKESEFDSVSPVSGRTFHLRARALRDGSGRVVGALVLAEDVTAERAAQAELDRARAFRDAVLTASPDVTTITEVHTGALTWASRSVGALLAGDPAGEHAPWTDGSADIPGSAEQHEVVVLAEDLGAVRAAEQEVAALPDGQSVTTRYRVRDTSGGIRWLSRRSTPFRRGPAGQVLQVLSVVREVTDLVEAERALQHAALHDPLTGLPNRTLLLDRIALAIERGERTGSAPAVLFCDLDGFKRINDIDGHEMGDAVLVEVARRLRSVLRSGDSIARVGGDEFVIVVDTNAQEARTGDAVNRGAGGLLMGFAERISAVLVAPIDHRGQHHVVSASIGMALAHQGSTARDVLRDADTAMYRAKQRGRNRIELFDDTLRADVVERAHIEQTLRDALDHHHPGPTALSVAYQPVYQLGSGRLTSFEALARLRDATGAFIDPDQFIPVAEDTGLIAALGERILDDSLAMLVRWRAAHPPTSTTDPPVTVAVNQSARRAQHANMPAVVAAALLRHGLRPADLVLELTESVLLDSGSSTLRQLVELHASGVGIAIDDFGTGYASLSYLATLPVSAVKIDRSFTASMTSNPVSGSIVRAIIALARELNLGCVVEGIETTDQLRALPGTVQGQGYLLGRPDQTPTSSWPGP